MDARWLPPSPDDLVDIKGRKAPNAVPEFNNAGQAIPLKDEQFLALLESIPDPRWRLAVGLVGAFGLRPVELNYCRPDGDGLRIEYQKRNARGCSPKRTVEALDRVDAPGMGTPTAQRWFTSCPSRMRCKQLEPGSLGVIGVGSGVHTNGNHHPRHALLKRGTWLRTGSVLQGC